MKTLANLEAGTTYTGTIKDILLVDDRGVKQKLAPQTFTITSETTGIRSMRDDGAYENGAVYMLDGQLVGKDVDLNKLPKGVYAKDVILRVLGDIKADGAVYKALEFTGSTFDEMSISSRMSIANMSVECGAKVALFEPNDAIAEMFGIDRKELEWLRTGEDECYERVLEYRAEDLVPVMACPPKVDNVHPVSEVAGTPVNQVFIGSCTNGRIEDLEAAAEILKGKHVAPFVKFLVTPASREVYEEAEKKGLLKIFIRAGAMITHPYCSLCQGRNGGVVSAGEVVIGTHNRNFRGRMGSPEARTYLASPAVAAASALCGKITDPRTLEQ